MAVDDLDVLRSQLPEVFEDLPPPPGWDDDWLIVPIDDPERTGAMGAAPDYETFQDDLPDPGSDGLVDTLAPAPDFNARFPGVPQTGSWGGVVPPPDAYAFYLPFHYFYPRWWGVYLILERVHELAADIRRRSRLVLDPHDALIAVRIFLYAHEAFHHIVESFATRLEVTHRMPLYRGGFDVLFRRVFGTDACLEEALATAHGYRRVKERAFPDHPHKRAAALRALESFIADCPPGYRCAGEFRGKRQFDRARSELAEQPHAWISSSGTFATGTSETGCSA